jgi:hypothetical protein
MSEDATDNWIVEPPPPMDAPGVERSFGKRKLAALANAGDAQSAHAPPVKRKRAAAVAGAPRASPASRAGQDHSKKSRNDINDGVLPYVPEVQQMWRNPVIRTALLQKRVHGRKVDDRIKWAKSMSPEVYARVASYFRTFEMPPRVPEVLGAFVWLAQQCCDALELVVEETHGKEVVKITGSRPCGCCKFSITLETCSGRWDDLGCKLEKRQERRSLKQQLKQQQQIKQ